MDSNSVRRNSGSSSSGLENKGRSGSDHSLSPMLQLKREPIFQQEYARIDALMTPAQPSMAALAGC